MGRGASPLREIDGVPGGTSGVPTTFWFRFAISTSSLPSKLTQPLPNLPRVMMAVDPVELSPFLCG
jgi:hypothetical protein